MSKVIVAVLTMFAVVAMNSDAFAQKKKCPKGKVVSATTGKCVAAPRRAPRPVPRGSH